MVGEPEAEAPSSFGRSLSDMTGHAHVVVVRAQRAVTAVSDSRLGTDHPIDQEALALLGIRRLRAIL